MSISNNQTLHEPPTEQEMVTEAILKLGNVPFDVFTFKSSGIVVLKNAEKGIVVFLKENKLVEIPCNGKMSALDAVVQASRELEKK